MKTMNTILSLLIILLFSTLNAQELGDFKPKDNTYKAKLLNKGSKKLYIASFTINFETYKEAIDKKKAGGFRNTIKNAAKAKAAIGLGSLDKEALQSKADQLYIEFVEEMKGKGYEIISAEEAGKTEVYQGYKSMTGPTIFETDMTGILSVVPTGYSFYYKDRTAFTNQFGGVSKVPQNLSKELNDALIADISLNYIFSETGADWNVGNQAKVKLFVNYRLANQFTVSDENTGTTLTSFVDKSQQSVGLSSFVQFTKGKLKIGGSAESQYTGIMKSDLEINDVLPKEKVVAYSSQTIATATSINPIVTIRGSNYSEKTKWLEPDGVKYAKGMYLAGSKFINYHLNEVFE
ncbi:hypothetical protein [Brumimicrobium oceani]|uniref:Uncharacterized protein n=1 Tax=Brumimicrobium oceani TaxID=2100725 RepID=A0A2U2XHE4_9FLAO|nr:hypothetical protein [Brumimicrobium oceani]PWH87216.1 hypothetical protein DIT68_02835 [Brumimicrobium oceani]